MACPITPDLALAATRVSCHSHWALRDQAARAEHQQREGDEGLERGTRLVHPVAEAAEALEASRLNWMVDDVLLVDRGDAEHMSLKMKSVDCNALVMNVVESFRPLTDTHQFVLDLDPMLHPIQGDRDRLSQALTNLVSNAVKYSPAGGTVTIVTRNDGDDVVVSVRDEGIGVAAEDLSRIFDRFERVETGIAGRIAGTGLGLSIVQEITSLHEGQIWAESELGLGSTFHLVVPAARSQESRSRGVEESRS